MQVASLTIRKVLADESGSEHLPTRSIARARAVTRPDIAFYRDRDEAVLSVRTAYKGS